MTTHTGTNARQRAARMRFDGMREVHRHADAMKEDAHNLAIAAGAAARQQMDPIKDLIAQKPLYSLLVAGGVGLVLGILFARR